MTDGKGSRSPFFGSMVNSDDEPKQDAAPPVVPRIPESAIAKAASANPPAELASLNDQVDAVADAAATATSSEVDEPDNAADDATPEASAATTDEVTPAAKPAPSKKKKPKKANKRVKKAKKEASGAATVADPEPKVSVLRDDADRPVNDLPLPKSDAWDLPELDPTPAGIAAQASSPASPVPDPVVEPDRNAPLAPAASAGPDLPPFEADSENAYRRRIVDVEAQMQFLEGEAKRYRDAIERERIAHATELAELRLQLDTQHDELERTRRGSTNKLHDSYRQLLSEQQIEFDKERAILQHDAAAALTVERERSDQQLRTERTRREVTLQATERQVRDELTREHERNAQTLRAELAQANATIRRLKGEIDKVAPHFSDAVDRAAATKRELDNVERRHRLEREQARSQLAEANRRVGEAERRLTVERNRMAATLSELLERSATIAAESDRANAAFEDQLSVMETSSASEVTQVRAEYARLAEAADHRAQIALQREAELEGVIAELRAELAQHHPQ
jgi:hypothetical protein